MSPRTEPSQCDFLAPLNVRIRMCSDSVVMTPCGSIDWTCVDLLDRALLDLPADTRSVVLNMAEVPFMDSAGLRFLQRLHDFGRRYGIPVAATNWLRQPRWLLDMTGYSPA